MTTYDEIIKELLQYKNMVAIYDEEIDNINGFVKGRHDEVSRDLEHKIGLIKKRIQRAKNHRRIK